MALSEQELSVLDQIGRELVLLWRGHFVGMAGFVPTWVSEGGVVGVAVDGWQRFEHFSRSAKPSMSHPTNLLYTWSEADWRRLIEARGKEREATLERVKLHIGCYILQATTRRDVNLNEGFQAAAGPITIMLKGFEYPVRC